MNVIITKERRFQLGSDGNIYTDNESASGYKFFQRYLDVFDSVTVVGRLQRELTTGNSIVTGPNVNFLPIPYYLGPTEYLLKCFEIDKVFDSIIEKNLNTSAFIARCPSKLGSILIKKLQKIGHPFGMEVVGDPYDVFAPGAIKHPLRPIFRKWFSRSLCRLCQQATALAYVTEYSLQRRYPPSPGAFNTHYSSIYLDPSAFVEKPRTTWTKDRPYELICVGTLAQLYKAPDVLIKAIEVCRRNGLDVRLNIVGDGKYRVELEMLVSSLGLTQWVRFLGQLKSGEPVRNELDKADVFVLPSKGEGLPRAMIEAMARGLPCIGTSASGIPELLDDSDMVEAGNVEALALKIGEVLSSPSRMAEMSERNLKKSKKYLNETLQKRRIDFFMEVKNKTEEFKQKSVLYKNII